MPIVNTTVVYHGSPLQDIRDFEHEVFDGEPKLQFAVWRLQSQGARVSNLKAVNGLNPGDIFRVK